MAKVVTLPLFVKERAEKHASLELKRRGMSLPSGYHSGKVSNPTPKENRAIALFNKVVQHYAMEYYTHGLGQKTSNPKPIKNIKRCKVRKQRPIKSRKKNPYAPKVAASTYKRLPMITGPDAPITKGITDPRERTIAEERLRAAVTSITQLYSKHVLGLKLDSAFNFPKGATEEQKKKIIMNRYRRTFGVIMISKAIEKFMSLTPAQIDSYLKELGISDELSVNHLQAPAIRAEFEKKVLGKA